MASAMDLSTIMKTSHQGISDKPKLEQLASSMGSEEFGGETLVREFIALEMVYEKSQKELERLHEQIHKQKIREQNLQSDMKDLGLQCADQQTENAELSRAKAILQSRIQELEEAGVDNSEHAEFQQDLYKLCEENEELRQDLEELEVQFGSKNFMLQRELKERCEELTEVKDSKEQARQEYTVVLRKCQVEFARRDEKYAKLEAQYQDTMISHSKCGPTMECLQNRLTLYQDDINKNRTVIETLQRELREAFIVIQRLKQLPTQRIKSSALKPTGMRPPAKNLNHQCHSRISKKPKTPKSNSRNVLRSPVRKRHRVTPKPSGKSKEKKRSVRDIGNRCNRERSREPRKRSRRKAAKRQPIKQRMWRY